MKKYFIQTITFSLLIYTLITISCQKLEPVAVTKFAPLSIDQITFVGITTASVKGVFMDVGEGIISYGHCWSKSPNPTITDPKTINTGQAPKQIEYTSQINNLLPDTKYYLRAYYINSEGSFYSNQIELNTDNLMITSPSETDHWVGGETHTITWNDDFTENVKILLYKNNSFLLDINTNASSNGSYDWKLPDNLLYDITYSIRIENISNPEIFGNSQNFKASEKTGSIGTMSDNFGNTYGTIKIGTQWWMAENLKTSKYNDNTDIVYPGSDNNAWQNNTTGAYAWQNNDIANKATYGALYNWHAVNTGKLCPTGWHVPTDDEWKTMEMNLGMIQATADLTGWRGTNEGSKLAGNGALWTDGSLIQNAAFGTSSFTALPGGYRGYDGIFGNIGVSSRWWSSTSFDATSAWRRGLDYGFSNVNRLSSSMSLGFSIRCLRD